MNRIPLRLWWVGALPFAALAHPFQALYGDAIRFEVLRDGQPVGAYTTRFQTTTSGWQAQVEMSLSLRVMMLWRYEYHYRASETWRQGQLDALTIRINDDGESRQLRFYRQGDQLLPGSGDADATPIDLPILTTHHFNPAIVDAQRILNTLTGKENQVRLIHLGEERVTAGDRRIISDRYRYQGDLQNTEVWYAKSGQWVKLRFPDATGTPIEFQCLDCGL